MKVRKGIILAAGFGTRMLPASKAVPKEMLPIVDKPAIQYIVEEMSESGIEEILIITSRGKEAIENHFDRSPELENALISKGHADTAGELSALSALADIYYLRQKEVRGTGAAVLEAAKFIGNEPFVAAYADDVFFCPAGMPASLQICRAFEQYGKGACCMKEVPLEWVPKYSSLAVQNIKDNLFEISDMIEKPAPGEEFSNYSIIGRMVLPAKILRILENTTQGAGGEIQLTDAMKELARTEGMIGVDYIGKRYDTGSKIGMLKANVETALKTAEIAGEFREFLQLIMNNE